MPFRPLRPSRSPVQTHVALFIAAGIVVVAALAFAAFGQAFPGDPDVAGGECGAPGGAGCTRAQDWPFIALFIGGPLAVLLTLAGLVALTVAALSNRRP